ncbi:hypothetical protein [Parashewanella tropica]|uniref:hypothetical protein n=1 Tax=Parashewanella tropica TaxID=2547970 RepID=UPI0010595E0F|nr:hypothetical protein [Parashewanella tropica]
MTSAVVKVSDVKNPNLDAESNQQVFWSCTEAKVHIETKTKGGKSNTVDFMIHVSANELISAWHIGTEPPTYSKVTPIGRAKITKGDHIARDLRKIVKAHKATILHFHAVEAEKQDKLNKQTASPKAASQPPSVHRHTTQRSQKQTTPVKSSHPLVHSFSQSVAEQPCLSQEPMASQMSLADTHTFTHDATLSLATQPLYPRGSQTSFSQISAQSSPNALTSKQVPRQYFSRQHPSQKSQETAKSRPSSRVDQLKKQELESHSGTSIGSTASEKERQIKVKQHWANHHFSCGKLVPNGFSSDEVALTQPAKPAAPTPPLAKTALAPSASLTQPVTSESPTFIYCPSPSKTRPLTHGELQNENATLRSQLRPIQERNFELQHTLRSLQQQLVESEQKVMTLQHQSREQQKVVMALKEDLREAQVKSKQERIAIQHYWHQQESQWRLSQQASQLSQTLTATGFTQGSGLQIQQAHIQAEEIIRLAQYKAKETESKANDLMKTAKAKLQQANEAKEYIDLQYKKLAQSQKEDKQRAHRLAQTNAKLSSQIQSEYQEILRVYQEIQNLQLKLPTETDELLSKRIKNFQTHLGRLSARSVSKTAQL